MGTKKNRKGESEELIPKSPGIVYSVVACDRQVVSEAHVFDGRTNLAVVLTRVLPKLPETKGPSLYQWEQYNLCVLTDMPMMFITVTEKEFKYTTVFAYLEAVQNRFKAMYGSVDHFRAHQCSDFDETLKKQGELYSTNAPINEKAQKVYGQIDEVRELMIDTIASIVDRREKIDVLVESTESLKSGAEEFHKGAGRLKRKYQCKNLKMTIIIASVVVVVMFLIVWLVICKPNFSNCSGKSK